MHILLSWILMSSINIISSDIVHNANAALMMAHEGTHLIESVTLGNKRFKLSLIDREEDRKFLQKINNPSYSPCGTGLSPQTIRHEYYNELKNMNPTILKNLSINVKPVPRKFWECNQELVEPNSDPYYAGEWNQWGFLAEAILCATSFGFSGLSHLSAIPESLSVCCPVLAESCNRLYYRFCIKTVEFDERGSLLQ
jgi:hypothetical protein